MWARWDSTVRTERNSVWAISAFVWPSAISRRTWTSRSVRSSGEQGAQSRVEVRAAFGDAPHGVHQLVVGGLLEHVPGRPGAQRAARELRVLLHGEDHDVRVGRDVVHAGDGVERAELARHVEIEHENRRLMAEHRAQRGFGVPGLGDDLEAARALEHHPQP